MAGRQIVITSVVAAIIVTGLGLGLYYSLPTLGSTGTSNSITTSPFQAVNSTYVATYFDTMIRANATTTTSTLSTTTATTSASISPRGSFTYSPANSIVKILSVQAHTSQDGSGNQTISFAVAFQNVGNITIYVARGGGSGLNATILSGSVKSVTTVRCDIAVAPSPLSPGENSSTITPGCWSGYSFILLQPGTIQVRMTLSWSLGMTSQQANSVVIDAEFNLM